MKKLLLALTLCVSTPALAEVDLTVDRSDLTVTIRQDGEIVGVEPVAMGKLGEETPLGTWYIWQIDVNPDWTSTRDGSYYAPGPRVPLGRIRMRYDGAYALHGTNNPNSIGTYASLGCIRMFNESVIDLAKRILQDSGDWESDSWFQNMLDNPTRMYRIPLRRPAKITITA